MQRRAILLPDAIELIDTAHPAIGQDERPCINEEKRWKSTMENQRCKKYQRWARAPPHQRGKKMKINDGKSEMKKASKMGASAPAPNTNVILRLINSW
jgi:hypothetical protein